MSPNATLMPDVQLILDTGEEREGPELSIFFHALHSSAQRLARS